MKNEIMKETNDIERIYKDIVKKLSYPFSPEDKKFTIFTNFHFYCIRDSFIRNNESKVMAELQVLKNELLIRKLAS